MLFTIEQKNQYNEKKNLHIGKLSLIIIHLHEWQIVFFTEDGCGTGERCGHPRPTYFWDFAPMPLRELMVLLLTCIWNVYFFHFLVWLPLPLNSILPALTRSIIEK